MWVGHSSQNSREKAEREDKKWVQQKVGESKKRQFIIMRKLSILRNSKELPWQIDLYIRENEC